MSWKGSLIKAGIASDGKNVEIFRGDFSVSGSFVSSIAGVGDTLSGHLIRYGTSGTPIIYTPASTGSHSGIQMYITSEDCISGLSLAAIRAKVTFTGTTKATAYGGLFWVKLDTQDGTGYTGDYLGGYPAGVQGVIEVPVDAVYTSANTHSWITGVCGEVRPLLGTIAQTGVISAVRALVNADNTNIALGVLVGLHVTAAYGGTVDAGVLVMPHTGSTITKGLHIDSQHGTITTGIDIGTCAARAINVLTTTATGSLTTVMVDTTYTKVDGWNHGVASKLRYKPTGASGDSNLRALQGICFMGVDGTTTTGVGGCVGVFGQLHFYDAYVMNGSSDIVNCAMNAALSSGGTPIFTSGHIACLHLQNNIVGASPNDTSGTSSFIYLDNAGAGGDGHDGQFDSVLYLNTYETPYLLDIRDTANGYIYDTTADASEDIAGHLHIRIDGADRYINVYSDAS